MSVLCCKMTALKFALTQLGVMSVDVEKGTNCVVMEELVLVCTLFK